MPNAIGKRIELNALTSRELVELVEHKLVEHGIEKIVPNASELREAYRHFKCAAEIKPIAEDMMAKANDVVVPRDLKKRVLTILEENPDMSWDAAVAKLAGWPDGD